ncbi:MAG TPA: LysR family transcriptional regulator [Devosiaceae bacterium]|nr:LysR family transcriptional regulator [Devosiaceae bacterium]
MFELSYLRCFVAVAEELHFGRAAERLNITQPPLSRQIRMLERAVGCELFIRNSRSVRLTQAGQTFLPDALRILRLIESAETSVRNVATGRAGILRCGFTAASAYAFLPVLVRNMKAAIPGASLILREMVSKRQIAALETGEIDVGLLRPPFDRGANEAILVAREEMVVALPKGHVVGEKPVLDWQDLDGLELIMYDADEAQYFNDLIASYLSKHRIFPIVDQRLTQIHSILSLVRAGVGCAVVPASARQLGVSQVDYREFGAETPSAELFLVWRKDNGNPLLPALAAIATSGGVQ